MTLGELLALIKDWQVSREVTFPLTVQEAELMEANVLAIANEAAQHAQTLRDAAEMLDGFLDAAGGVSHYPADVRAVADWLARAGER